MEICSIAETELVESKVLSGSMATGYERRTLRRHAVRLIGGAPEDRAVCGFRVAKPGPDETLFDWENENFSIRCRACAEALGEPTAVAGR